MKRIVIVTLGVSLAFLCGCTVLDSLFGVNPDGTQNPGGGILGTAATFLNFVLPGVLTAAGTATTAYAALRGKRWKDATLATFKTIEAGASLGKSVKELKTDLKQAHEKAGGKVVEVVKSVVDKFGHTPSEPAKS